MASFQNIKIDVVGEGDASYQYINVTEALHRISKLLVANLECRVRIFSVLAPSAGDVDVHIFRAVGDHNGWVADNDNQVVAAEADTIDAASLLPFRLWSTLPDVAGDKEVA